MKEYLNFVINAKNKNIKPLLQLFYKDYNFNFSYEKLKIFVDGDYISQLFNDFVDFLLNIEEGKKINKIFYTQIHEKIDDNQHKRFLKNIHVEYENKNIINLDYKVKKLQISKEINKLSKNQNFDILYNYIKDFYFKDSLYAEGVLLIFIYQISKLFKYILYLFLDSEDEIDMQKEESLRWAKEKYKDFLNEIITSNDKIIEN